MEEKALVKDILKFVPLFVVIIAIPLIISLLKPVDFALAHCNDCGYEWKSNYYLYWLWIPSIDVCPRCGGTDIKVVRPLF